jgi:hypothetical protein
MRVLRSLLPFVLVIVIVDAPQVRAEAHSFKLTISAAEDVVKVGGTVRVKIQLKNTSEDDIFLGGGPCGQTESDTTLQDFHPVVKDAQGKEPPLTKLGRVAFRRPNPGETFPDVVIECVVPSYPLPPGESHTAEIILSDVYDLSIQGSYTVQILFDSGKQGVGVPLEHIGRKKEIKQEVTPRLVTISVVP